MLLAGTPTEVLLRNSLAVGLRRLLTDWTSPQEAAVAKAYVSDTEEVEGQLAEGKETLPSEEKGAWLEESEIMFKMTGYYVKSFSKRYLISKD